MNFKTLTKWVWSLLFVSSFLFVSSGIAQITIDITEYPHDFGHTFTLYDANSANGFSVNLGTPGGPQTWTFNETMFPGGIPTTQVVVDPATTPFGNDFPASDHAWFSHDSLDGSDDYVYFDLTSSELHLLGLGSHTQNVDTAIVFDNPSTVATFPLSLNDSWNDQYTISFTVDSLGLTLDVVVSNTTNTTIDAWGTIDIPLGTFECLRAQQFITQITTVYLFGIPLFADTTNTIQYSWLGENHGILATVTSFDGETDPNFTLAEDVMFQVPTGPTGIEPSENLVVKEFKLLGNYPNPFNPSTTIAFQIPKAEHVKLTVYNIAGEQVATLVNNYLEAGKYDVEFDARDLPSGIYFYQIQAGEYQAVRRMALIK
ncbi:MAG: T9SS C-terminal target domain-containing protein [Methanobacteriota archaeon]|nr:MAG: T9SS C-terminal target domain-containing protein [Euryarchaeota archaeon]